MKHLLRLLAGTWFLTSNFLVQAQFRAPGGLPAGFHRALLDVLAAGPSFHGRAMIQVSNGPDKQPVSMSCNIAVLSGNMRLEVDSFQAGANVPPAEAARLRSMHSITLLRPDRNRMYLIFPDFGAYVEMSCCKSAGTDALPPPEIAKTALGKEVVNGQSCDKGHWNVTEADGEHYDTTVWTSTNSSSIPIQVEIGAPPALVVFQDLRLEAPNSSLFEPPASYTKYQGIPEIIQREAQKARNANTP